MKMKRKLWIGGIVLLAALAVAGIALSMGGGSSYSLAEFRVGKLTCGSCAQKIGRALDELPGIGKVDVNVAAGRARVEFDPSKTDPGQVRAAIVAAGYPADLERTLAAEDYRKEGETADRYVARIGNRLVPREDFEAELARLQRSVPPGQAEAAAPRLRRLAWTELLARQLWLVDAEASGLKVEKAEVAGEMERLRTEGRLPELLARFGDEAKLRRDVEERLTVERHLERNVLQGVDPALRPVRLDLRLRQVSAAVPVEILDPSLKASLGGGGGCGGCC